MPPKFLDITKVKLPVFGIAVVGKDHPLAIPTKSRQSAEFIGYRMKSRGQSMITVLEIIIEWLSCIIYLIWGNDQDLTGTTKERTQRIVDLNLKLCC